jgi:hypothetical protein
MFSTVANNSLTYNNFIPYKICAYFYDALFPDQASLRSFIDYQFFIIKSKAKCIIL